MKNKFSKWWGRIAPYRIIMDDMLDHITMDVISGNLSIPTLPSSVGLILSKLDDPNLEIDAIVTIISSDQVITSRVIQCASSVYSSPRATIRSVRQAVVRLGLDTIRTLVTAIGVEMIYASNDSKLAYYLKKQWQKNIIIMATSLSILKHSKYAATISKDEVMLLSIIHSIGMIPFIQQLASSGQINLDNLSPIVCEPVREVASHIISIWGFNPIYSTYLSNLGYGLNTGSHPTPTDIVLAAYCAYDMNDSLCKKFNDLLMHEGDSILGKDVLESRRLTINNYTE